MKTLKARRVPALVDSRDARLLLEHARAWARRGLLAPGALDTLEAEYGSAAVAADGTPGVGLAILYALAGVLLGAACVAVPTLLHSKESEVPWWLLGFGLPVLAAGLLLWRKGGSPGLVDALLIGCLVPLTVLGLPDKQMGQWLAPISLAVAIVVTWLPRASATAPVIGSIAIFAAAGILTHRLFGDFFDSQAASWTWLALAFVQFAATLAFARGRPWRPAVLALLCVGVVIPFVLGLDRALPSHSPRFYELMVGGLELALLMLGLGLRERGVVLGAAIVVAIDAIAYAFETNVILGIVVLLGVATALVLLAGSLKRLVQPRASR